MTCEKHRKAPARGYSECEGCEVESLQSENKLLRETVKDLIELVKGYQQRETKAET